MFERSVEINPAFDRRDPNPKKDYGIHSVDLKFLLKGERGVVQFVIYTGWYLPQNHPATHPEHFPMAADIGYHSYVPLYEGQKCLNGSCRYLDGKPCYYDGSGLQAEDFLKVMIAEGGETMWKKMEEWYNNHFGEIPLQEK